MIESLSVAASVAGLIPLGIQVTQSLVDVYNAYKNRVLNLVDKIERLESLLDIFQCFTKTLSDCSFQARCILSMKRPRAISICHNERSRTVDIVAVHPDDAALLLRGTLGYGLILYFGAN